MKNPYIEILKLGRQPQGVRYSDIVGYLQDKNISFYPEQITHDSTALQYVFAHNFQSFSGEVPTTVHHSTYYFLKPESLAYLLNYEALELAKMDSATARKEAKKALKITAWSLGISVVTTIISIVIQLID